MTGLPLHDDGADGDAGVHGAVVVDVAHRASVGAPAGALQLLDDLHGPDLGCAAHRARGEGGPEQAEGVVLRPDLPSHVADDVHHVAVALHCHHGGDGHRAVLADPAQVVPAQVHQHHVLRPLLGIGEELLGQGLVLLLGGAPPAGAGDGVQVGLAILQAHVHLRAGADDPHRLPWDAGHPAEVQEVHVGGGVEHAQGPVDGEGIRLRLPAQALAEHHLEDVPRGDVLLGLAHVGLVLCLGEVAAPFRPAAALPGHGRDQGLAQVGHDLIDAGHRVRVGGPEIRLHPHVGDDEELVLHVIEDHQVVREEEDHVRHLQVPAGGAGQPLHEAHQVVAEVAHRAAGKAGQAGQGHRPTAGHDLLHDRQGIPLAGLQHRAPGRADGHLVLSGHHGHGRVYAQEAVAPQLLPLLHRLQQEAGPGLGGAALLARGAGVAQLQVDRDGCLQVRGQLPHDGDEVALLGQFPHFLQGGSIAHHGRLSSRSARFLAGSEPATKKALVLSAQASARTLGTRALFGSPRCHPV